MKRKGCLARAASLMAGTVAIAGLSAPGAASASTTGAGFVGPVTCAVQTYDGHYLTAVGGGRITNTIHSDATRIQAWEMFRVPCGV